jgi:hypothetical protein
VSGDQRDFGALAEADDDARWECVEPLMRIYTEATSKKAVARLLESARSFAMGG